MQIYFSIQTHFSKFLTLFGQFDPKFKENVNYFNSNEPFENSNCITFRL